MRDRVFGCALGALLLVVACGKSTRSPGEELEPPEGIGGGTKAGNGSAGQKSEAGKPATGGGAPASGGASAGGGAPASGGSPVTSGAAGLLGVAGSDEGGAGASDGGATSSSCDGTYLACGCGCCLQTVQACYYPELGESRAAVEMADQATAVNLEQCTKAGCTAGKYYQCCEALPPEPGRRYGVTTAFGGLNHLTISKFTGFCSSLALAQPLTKSQDFPLQLPEGWDIQQLQRSPCNTAERANAIGALGTVALRVDGEKCVVDAHFTAFFVEQNGVEGERFDIDGYPLDMGLAFCK